MFKGSSERFPKASHPVTIKLERLQCRLQDSENAEKGKNLSLWPQEYYQIPKYQKLIDTIKPTSWECFGDPNDPTCGKKFTQAKRYFFGTWCSPPFSYFLSPLFLSAIEEWSWSLHYLKKSNSLIRPRTYCISLSHQGTKKIPLNLQILTFSNQLHRFQKSPRSS